MKTSKLSLIGLLAFLGTSVTASADDQSHCFTYQKRDQALIGSLELVGRQMKLDWDLADSSAETEFKGRIVSSQALGRSLKVSARQSVPVSGITVVKDVDAYIGQDTIEFGDGVSMFTVGTKIVACPRP